MDLKRLMLRKPGLLRQTRFILLGALCASLLAALLLAGLLFHRTLLLAEQDQVRTSLSQTQSLLDMSLENLSRNCADWANWDESYRLVRQGDSSFRSRNLTPETFSNNDLDFMAFLTLDGRLMEGAAYDRQQQQVRGLTPALRASLAANGAIGRRLVAATPDTAISGLLLLEGVPTLLSLQPVRRSDHSGPSGGWLLWGQHASAVLERGYLSVLAHQAELHPAGVPFPAGQPLETANSPLGSRMFTGADELRGYRFLTDLNGKPALFLETRQPRELMHQGNLLLVACFLALMAMLALFGALAFWTLKRRIGQRLDELRRGIGKLVIGNYGALLNIQGQDEVALVGNFIDRLVHSRVHANRRVETLRRHGRQVFEQSPNPMLIVRDQHILAVNPAGLRLFGYRDDSPLVGQPLASLQEDAGVRQRQAAELERRLMGAERYFEWEFIGRQGRRLPCELVVTGIHYQGLPAQQLFLRDLRDRKRQEQQITQLAYHDRLTGLANRFRLQQWVQARLDALSEEGADQSRVGFALLLVSVDEYKSIIAAFGQEVADGVLRIVAERLCKLDVKASVARLDSDEFVVWLPRVVDPEQAMGLARTMQRQLAAAMQLDNLRLEMSASIGVVVGGARYRLALEVLQGASYAVRRAQEEGTGQIRLFNRELKLAATEEMCIRTDLPQAIRSGQLQPHFQPMIDCRNGHLLGFEALSRWQHPRLGAISPARFIPIAETSEAIIDLGEHVLHAACEFIAAAESARQCSGPPLMVHVNISARHFASAALVDCIEAAIRASGIAPSQLVIEITESLLMKRPQDSLATMRRIKEFGVGLALDDFGTGYSSLSTLYEYPIDVVKLDRAFVWRVVDGGPGEHLVQAIVTMAQTLGFRLVAEGVETVQQQQKLHALGITAMQGFLFYRPLSNADALRAMATCQVAEPWLRADGATESPLLV